MAPYQRVAVLGKGWLGTTVVLQLAKAGFHVTVLTRSRASVRDAPSGVSVVEVDYSSPDSVTRALRGQDVLVNTVNAGAIAGQKPIIDAAIASGVKRYVPADFGSFTTDPKARELQIVAPMADIQNYLKEKAAEGAIEWTLFQTGAFLDMILGMVPLAFDLGTRTIQWYDDGEAEFSATTSTTVANAISAALKRPSETKNRVVFVHDAVVTQKKLVDLAKTHAAPGPGWAETRIQSSDEIERTLDLARQGKFDPMVGLAQLKAALLSGRYRSRYEKVDNEMLGLDPFGEKNLEALAVASFARYG